MSVPAGEYGELLLSSYLKSRGIAFSRHPVIPSSSKILDFLITTPSGREVYIEVKTIGKIASKKFHPFNGSVQRVRRAIDDANEQLRTLRDRVLLLALARRPDSPIGLTHDHIMQTALYGRLGIVLPFDPVTGSFDRDRQSLVIHASRSAFVDPSQPGGKRREHIAGLLCLDSKNSFKAEEGSEGNYRRQLLQHTKSALEDGSLQPTVTYWANPSAERKVEGKLFTESGDKRWDFDREGFLVSTCA